MLPLGPPVIDNVPPFTNRPPHCVQHLRPQSSFSCYLSPRSSAWSLSLSSPVHFSKFFKSFTTSSLFHPRSLFHSLSRASPVSRSHPLLPLCPTLRASVPVDTSDGPRTLGDGRPETAVVAAAAAVGAAKPHRSRSPVGLRCGAAAVTAAAVVGLSTEVDPTDVPSRPRAPRCPHKARLTSVQLTYLNDPWQITPVVANLSRTGAMFPDANGRHLHRLGSTLLPGRCVREPKPTTINRVFL